MWNENGYISHYVKREQKIQNTVSNKKIPDATEYCVRVEPGTPLDQRPTWREEQMCWTESYNTHGKQPTPIG